MKQELPAVGEKLWRSVAWIHGALGDYYQSIDDAHLIRSDNNNFWVFVGWYQDQFCTGWRVWPKANRFRGLVVFVSGDVPEDWTYLRVTSHSRSGSAVFAEAVAGPEDELLQAYEHPRGWEDERRVRG